MKLTAANLEALNEVIKNELNEADLEQVLRFKMGVDMFKEWVAHGQPFKDIVYIVVNKVEELGSTVLFLDVILAARPNNVEVQKALPPIRASLINPATGGAKDSIVSLKEGISELEGRLQEAPMRQTVKDYEVVLHKLSDQITLLRTYKSLHDCLHKLQLQLRGLATATRTLGTNPDAPSDLVQCLTMMKTLREDVVAAIDHLPNTPPYRESENRWLQQYDRAIGLAQQASDNTDPGVGKQCVFEVKGIIRRQPVRIDSNLTATASALEVTDLKSLFVKISNTPGIGNGDRDRFLAHAVAAEQLFRQLRALVNQHGEWQRIDQGLWDADENLPKSATDDASNFDAIWMNVTDPLRELLNAESQAAWAKSLADRRDKIAVFRKDEDWPKFGLEFARFRAESTVQFFAVDSTLLQLSGQIASLGDDLLQLLTKI